MGLLAILADPIIVLTEELDIRLPIESEADEADLSLDNHPFSRYFQEYVTIIKEDVLTNVDSPPFEQSWLSTIILLRGFALLKLIFVFEMRRRMKDIRYFVLLLSDGRSGDFFVLREKPTRNLDDIIKALCKIQNDVVAQTDDEKTKKQYRAIGVRMTVEQLEEMAAGLWVLTNIDQLRLVILHLNNAMSFANANIHKDILERKWGLNDITSLDVIPPTDPESTRRNEELRNAISKEVNDFRSAMEDGSTMRWVGIQQNLDMSSMSLIRGSDIDKQVKSVRSRTGMSSQRVTYKIITEAYSSRSGSKVSGEKQSR